MAEAEEAFRNAMLKADRSQFEAVTADQLSDGHSAGRVETAAQCIDAATSGQSRWTFIMLTDQTTHIVGDHAIVRHTFTEETVRDGKTNPVTIGVLMVWHKPDGDWTFEPGKPIGSRNADWLLAAAELVRWARASSANWAQADAVGLIGVVNATAMGVTLTREWVSAA